MLAISKNQVLECRDDTLKYGSFALHKVYWMAPQKRGKWIWHSPIKSICRKSLHCAWILTIFVVLARAPLPLAGAGGGRGLSLTAHKELWLTRRGGAHRSAWVSLLCHWKGAAMGPFTHCRPPQPTAEAAGRTKAMVDPTSSKPWSWGQAVVVTCPLSSAVLEEPNSWTHLW